MSEENKQALQNQQANKPAAYQPQYQQNMDDLMGQIQNRPKFQYDVNADALYQQVAQNYIQQGRNAMMDTMGQAAALTGGYGNSYAQMAGQQTYQGYLQGLTDLVPQYYQMALDRYQMEGDDLLDRYALYAQQEESDYARYQDNLDRYYADLDRAQNAYDNERDYDYGRFADNRDFEYGQYMDQLAYEQWEKEFEEEQRRYNQEWEAQQAAANSSGGSGGGGGSESGNGDSGDGGGGQGSDVDIAAEYLAMKKAGASTADSDSYLRAAIAAGLISSRDATELRDSRY